MKKLLLISTNTVHSFNYYLLIKDYFDEILFITDSKNTAFDYGKLQIIYTNFSIQKPYEFLNSLFKIRKIINEYNPTIIHNHQVTTNALLAVLANGKPNKPMVITAWGSDVLSTPAKGIFYKLMVRFVLRKVNYFTADAQYMADIMNQIAGKKLNVLVANFGIDETELDAETKENIIFSNRQLKSLYRIDKIIEAFARFVAPSKNAENWKLIVAATENEEEKLKKLTYNLGIEKFVEFVGWLDKKQNAQYYKISKIYISIPESDGTSISLLEAMYAGCLPILSDLPANREWVIHNENGFIVSDIESNYIKQALEIDLVTSQSINKKRIYQDGTIVANRKKFIEFYEEMITMDLKKCST